jgi:hypothetical protein
MKTIIGMGVLAFAATLVAAPADSRRPSDSSDPRNCPARGQPGRTECLRNMVQRGEAENARNNAYYASLNQSMRKACDTAAAADAAARMAGRSANPTVRVGGRVWTSARALANFALGQQRECDRLRRELRGR